MDLAKNVFQVHDINERGAVVLRKRLRRDQVARFFAPLEPCLIGIEPCGGAHYWAGRLTALGQRVQMTAPQFVKPYVKTNKNDLIDAGAIGEAVARPNMRFVPVKSPEQQSALSLRTARESFVHARSAQANRIRGQLIDFGLISSEGILHVEERVPPLISDASVELPLRFRLLIDRLLQQLRSPNVYLRTLLIHGGRAMVQLARTRPDRAGTWLGQLACRRRHNVAAVAMANRNARLAWALLASIV